MRAMGRSSTSSRVTDPWLAVSARPIRFTREAVTTTSDTVLAPPGFRGSGLDGVSSAALGAGPEADAMAGATSRAGVWASAVLVNSQETFDDFQKLSAAHPFTAVGYFAVPWSDAEDGTDELAENWWKA